MGGGTSIATDFNTIVYRIKLLGFNSVRLPFAFDTIELPPKPKEMTCKVKTINDIIQSTIDPKLTSNTIKQSNAPIFTGYLPSPNSNKCNTYYETKTTVDRLYKTIYTLVHNGLIVVLDYHPMGREGYARQPDVVAAKWKDLITKIMNKPTSNILRGKLYIDIMNEPDSMGLGWNHMTSVYIKTMNNIYNILGNDSVFLIEGTGQTGYNLNWGDGFITDKNVIKQYGINDASPFFEAILTKPYLKNIVISPHMYGPSISNNRKAHKGMPLFKRMDKSFGYLSKNGYCSSKTKTCQTFPIVIGEFGSMFADKGDLEHLDDFSKYMRIMFGEKMGWMYWAWNRNSGDTHGLVKDDWEQLEWGKLRWLQQKMYLKPWYGIHS